MRRVIIDRIATTVALAAATVGAALCAAPVGASVSGSPAPSVCRGTAASPFGPNVCVFSDRMSQAQVQSDLNAIAAQQVPIGSQFDARRYALLFEPGTYGSAARPLVFQVGYYTQVAGLGATPRDTVINGAADSFNNLFTGGSCNADDNFWR